MVCRRPIIRYHGGKWILADWIISYFPRHKVYVEPFGGAASVLLKKPRSYAEVYNDLDGELVNLFRVARDNGRSLIDALRLTPFARDEFMGSYEPTEDPLEMARRTVIKSFMGFGGNSLAVKTGFRANSTRRGTTPAKDWLNYPKTFDAVIERMQGVVLENRGAIEVMTQHDGPETLHYVDPPYLPETRTGIRGYKHELAKEDHPKLAETLRNLKGYVVLSGYRSDLYDELFSDWERVDKTAMADGARIRTECLWLSPNCKKYELF